MSVQIVNGNIEWVVNGTIYIANGKQANCTLDTCPLDLSVYGYRPSIAASGTLIALYAVTLLAQFLLGFRYKTWFFMGATLLGGIDEIIGYIGRNMYWHNPFGRTGFIMQIVLITIGPVFYTAAIYVSLGLIISYIAVEKSRLAPKMYAYIFVSCDIISLILQAVGGAMSASSNTGSKSGVDIALAGLSFQVACLFFFVVLVVDYLIRSRSYWHKLSTSFLSFCTFSALATIFIFIRCCYRIYELSDGYSRNSKALHDQGEFIGLESVMVLLAAYCLIAAHPGFAFGRPSELTREKHISNDSLPA